MPQSRESAGRVPAHIGFVSSWNTRCGIAEYSRYLTGSLDSGYRCSVFANRAPSIVRPDETFVSRCWDLAPRDGSDADAAELVQRILDSRCDVLSIQFNYGLISPGTLNYVIGELKRRAGIPIVVTLHATSHERYADLVSALQEADGVIVHRADELRRLQESGIGQTRLQPQGIYSPQRLQRAVRDKLETSTAFTIGCFGFLLPPKGVYELLQAFEAAAFVNPGMRLKLLNSLYDHPQSYAYAADCIRLIRQSGLSDRVFLCTDFLDQDVILDELSACDLVVLPYTHSEESSSAAIRLPLASLTPVLCSDIGIFREFAGIVHFFPVRDVISLANRMIELSTDPDELHRFQTMQRRYVDELSWSNVGLTFQSIIEDARKVLEVRSATVGD